MVGLAEWTDEKEILFPEMTALIIGLLIIDKRVWNVKRWQIILLMTLGAAVGICIVRYSPLPYVVNLCAAFAFAGASLFNQSRYTNSSDISLRIARFASYGKYRLSDSSLFNVSVSSACTNHPTPPLMVTFVEMVNSKQDSEIALHKYFLFLTTVATLGTVLQIVGHHHLHLPESIVTLTIAAILFLIFEWTGKYFAPSGALAFIPMLLPQEGAGFCYL